MDRSEVAMNILIIVLGLMMAGTSFWAIRQGLVALGTFFLADGLFIAGLTVWYFLEIARIKRRYAKGQRGESNGAGS